MIHFYNNNNKSYEVDLNATGDFLLDRQAVIFKSLDNTHIAKIVYPYTEVFKITEAMIIRVCDDEINQLYRISNISVDTDTNNLKIEADAIFIDLRDIYVHKLLIANTSKYNALQEALKSTLQPHNFKISSKSENDVNIENIEVVSKNILDFLYGADTAENSTLEKFNGEIEIDNYDIVLKCRIGQDKDMIISDDRANSDISIDINTDALITRILPYNGSGLYLENLECVDSPLIDNYSHIFFKRQEFDVDFEVIDETSERPADYDARKLEAQNKLKELALKFFNDTNADKPQISIDAKISGYKEDKYKRIKKLLKLNLGDSVLFESKKYGIKQNRQRVIEIEYISATTKKNSYISSITLSSVKDKLSNNLSQNTSKPSTGSSGGSGGDNDELYKRVLANEKKISTLEHNADKFELRFSSQGQNKLSNGAFSNNLDFWTYNKHDSFSYRVSKDNDLNENVCCISSNILNTEINKAFIISDYLELKDKTDYTLSYDFKISNGCSGIKISLICKENKADDIFKEVVLLDNKYSILETDKVVKLKQYIDFTTLEPYKFFRLKIENAGMIENNIDANNVAIESVLYITRIQVAEGKGYLPFKPREVLQGITKITEKGIKVSHTEVDTASHLTAMGSFIIDEITGNILSVQAATNNFSYVITDKIYASNIQNSIINRRQYFELTNTNKKYIIDILNDVKNIARHRIDSVLEIEDNRRGTIYDDIILENFSGSPVFIDMSYADKNRILISDIIIKNCTAPIYIRGLKSSSYNYSDKAKISASIYIENCSSVFIEGHFFDGLDSNFSLMNKDTLLEIRNSKVYFKNNLLRNYFYFMKIYNSEITIDHLCGDCRKFIISENSKIFYGGTASKVMIPNFSLSADLKNGSKEFYYEDTAEIIKKNINYPLLKPIHKKNFKYKLSYRGGHANAWQWDFTENKPVENLTESIKVGLSRNRFEKKNLAALIEFNTFNVSQIIGNVDTAPAEIYLEFLLKTKSVENRKYKISAATTHSLYMSQELKIYNDAGTLYNKCEIIQKNIIRLPKTFAFNLCGMDGSHNALQDGRTASILLYIDKDINNVEEGYEILTDSISLNISIYDRTRADKTLEYPVDRYPIFENTEVIDIDYKEE